MVYKHAMTECADPQLALTFLQISFEMNNNFVEKFILDDVLEQYGDVSQFVLSEGVECIHLETSADIPSLPRSQLY